MDIDQNLYNDFLAEAREHMENIEEDLLMLESKSGGQEPEIIASVFRAIHSIKGAAGYLGLNKISKLTHVMETMLQMIRIDEIKPDSNIIDALLKGVDNLNLMLGDLKSSNNFEISFVYSLISDLIEQATSPKIKKEMLKKTSLLDLEGSKLEFEISEFDIKNIPNEQNFLYVLKYNLHDMQKDKKISPLLLIKKLLSTGSIIEAKLHTEIRDITQSLDQIACQPLMYQVLYATIVDSEIIQNVTGLPKSQIIEINKSASLKSLNENPVNEKTVDSKQVIENNINKNIKPDDIIKNSNQNAKKTIDNVDTIRLSVDILDKLMTLAGELVLVRNQHLLAADKSDPVMNGISQRLDIVTSELQETIMRTRMQPIGNIFSKLPRIVRDLSQKLNKDIQLNITGQEVELDKTILESLADPLIHIIRNSCDHGIEDIETRKRKGKPISGNINIKAFHEAGHINIYIKDDGKGINIDSIKAKAVKNDIKSENEISQMNDKELLNLIMLPGFSTAEKISDVSGRGVGMDVVKTSIEKLGGSIELDSVLEESTTIILRLPLTLAIIPCLIIMVDDSRYAIPQVNLEELVSLYKNDVMTKIECAGSQEVYRLRGKLLPMIRLNEVLKRNKPFNEDIRAKITKDYSKILKAVDEKGKQKIRSVTFAVVKIGDRRFGLIVDKIIGTEEIVVKPMHSSIKHLNIYSGSTVMGDGKVALILDIEGIARHVNININKIVEDEENNEIITNEAAFRDSQTVLLVKSGASEQFAVPLSLIRRIEKIPVSKIELIGKKEFVTIDDITTRIVRLENVLNVSKCIEQKNISLILPKHIKRPYGILISSVVDTAQISVKLDTESYREDGLLGSTIINNKITLFLDIYRLIEKLEPDWFEASNKRNKLEKIKKNILVVEDSGFMQQLEQRYLESDNYNVTIANNGKEALEILKQDTFDLIISDIDMPIMNGWDFIKNVRKNDVYKDIPAIALTSLDSDYDKQFAKEIGFNDFLNKIDREKMLNSVSNFLDNNYNKFNEDKEINKNVSNSLVKENSKRNFCTFWISDRLFGVDILGVKEITSVSDFTPVHHSPEEIKGYVNIRGQIHLVVDLKKLLGYENLDLNTKSKVILFKSEIGPSFGVLVDSIGDVVSVFEKQIEEQRPLSVQSSQIDSENKEHEKIVTAGFCKLQNNLLQILNAKRFLKVIEKN